MASPQEEASARAIFAIAIRDNQCAELLNHLFEGGGVTIDVRDSGSLILIPTLEIERIAREAGMT